VLFGASLSRKEQGFNFQNELMVNMQTRKSPSVHPQDTQMKEEMHPILEQPLVNVK
jgi:hypothetical protein